MRNVYCTYFNSGYLSRGIVLIRSMREHVPGFELEVLCFDDSAYEFLRREALPGVRPCRLADFEGRCPEVASVKPSRSTSEYFFTCTSNWTWDVAERNPTADMVTYLDADMRFYSSPEPALAEMANRDVMICEHEPGGKETPFGRFNVGWLTFRLSETGLRCLRKWKDDCVDWCYDRVEDGKFADQKYLDAWPAMLGERLAIAPRTLDLGPWGVGRGEFKVVDGTPSVGGLPIILYHFQGLRILDTSRYYLGYYFNHSIRALLTGLYEPYIRELQTVEREFSLNDGNARYARGGFLYNLLTSYRLGHPFLADVKRIFQSLVNSLR